MSSRFDPTRAAVAVIAVIALGVSVWAWAVDEVVTAGVSARVGLILAAVWVAWPSLVRLSLRSVMLVGLGAVVLLWRPRAAWLVLPILLLTLGRPRSR